MIFFVLKPKFIKSPSWRCSRVLERDHNKEPLLKTSLLSSLEGYFLIYDSAEFARLSYHFKTTE